MSRCQVSIGLLDFARIADCVCAVLALLMMGRRAHRVRILRGDSFAIYATAALAVVMALVVIAELNQFGEKLHTLYGLPMLSLATILTLVALAKSKV